MNNVVHNQIPVREYSSVEKDGGYPLCRQAKAESLVVNSVGHRPTNWDVRSRQALKGRNQDVALSGLGLRRLRQDRAIPYPNDNKAFSLSLTGICSSPSCSYSTTLILIQQH